MITHLKGPGNTLQSTSMLAALVLVATTSVAAAAGTKPNIIVTIVDDLGWNGMGFNSFADSTTRANNSEVITPTVDALARSGVILDSFYVYKFCSPSRASFLTGRLPG